MSVWMWPKYFKSKIARFAFRQRQVSSSFAGFFAAYRNTLSAIVSESRERGTRRRG